MLLYYLPDDLELQADQPETILQVSLRYGIPHTHVCGGNARCSTCRVLIVEGLENCLPRNEKEQAMADRLRFSPDIRLACQTMIQGRIKLRRLILDDEDIELADQTRRGAVAAAVGQEKCIAILFSDIRGFTSFSETLPAYDVIHVLNRYFHEVGQVIAAHGGYIDNYMGDGILALFGVDDPTDAPLRAIRAGLDMLKVVDTHIKPYMESTYGNCFEIGIGIHYGDAVVGAIGARNMKRETVIGDSVNFASRIESANKDLGTNLLISEDAYMQVRDKVVLGKIGFVSIKGKTGEHQLYEVVGLKE
jgi:adenylate cyclase